MIDNGRLQKNSLLRSLTRLFLLILLAISLCAGFSVSGAGAASNPKYASIVMDADTGLILHQSNADKILHPASLVKVMTLMLTFDAIERGELRLRDRVIISRHAASMIPSKLDLPPGSSLRVEDAIYALVTKSANDVAVALAEKIAGSESAFTVRMNRKAGEIGMTRTRFRNASGLHNPNQISTVRDMARMSRYLVENYPSYYSYFSTRSFTYNGKTYRNHNRLMDSYEGMDGLKTGYIQASGFNLAASAMRNNKRLIGVVFGGRTAHRRNAHMAALLDKGFTRLDTVLMATRSVPIPKRRPDLSVHLAALSDIEPAAGDMAATIEDAATKPDGEDNHTDNEGSSKWAAINPMLQDGAFRKLIGEGDYDPAVSKRIETGLIAIAAMKESQKKNGVGGQDEKTISFRPKELKGLDPARTQSWSIQIGAFSSRAKTDKALQTTLRNLPANLTGAETIIVPLKTKDGWLFRGRLGGYEKEQAIAACQHIKACMLVSPHAY